MLTDESPSPREREAPRRESVDRDQYTPLTREPISDHSQGADATREDTAAAAPAPPKMTAQEVMELSEEQKIEAIVDKVVIHAFKPMENLPDLPLPELKVIGRCIIFKGETLVDGTLQQMYYDGLVNTINKDTVSLIHVHRYTEEDFMVHYAKEQEAMRRDAEAAGKVERTEEELQRMRERDQSARTNGGGLDNDQLDPSAFRGADDTTAPPANGFASLGEGGNAGQTAREDYGLSLGANPSDISPRRDEDGPTEEHGEINKRVRTRLRNHTGSMGPIPFVSFARTHIHEVQFGRDPRSDFYRLFQDPTKRFFDMQCLRMFCRRYIVHTAQGNNPRQIPLRAFVTCRCSCPELDNDLLNAVTREEVAHLVKITRNFKRARQPVTARERLTQANNFEAPPGIFQNTGALHVFRIPQRLFAFGICLIALAIVTAIVYGVIQMNIDANVMWYYVREYIAYVAASIVVWGVTGGLTIVTSTRISMPVTILSLRYGLVLLLMLGSAACGIMCIVVLARSLTDDEAYRFFFTTTRPIKLEAFYHKYHCSGFTQSCGQSNLAYMKCDSDAALLYPKECHDYMMKDVQMLMIPVIVFAAFVACIDFLALLTLHKATMISTRVSNGQLQVRRARRNRDR